MLSISGACLHNSNRRDVKKKRGKNRDDLALIASQSHPPSVSGARWTLKTNSFFDSTRSEMLLGRLWRHEEAKEDDARWNRSWHRPDIGNCFDVYSDAVSIHQAHIMWQEGFFVSAVCCRVQSDGGEVEWLQTFLRFASSKPRYFADWQPNIECNFVCCVFTALNFQWLILMDFNHWKIGVPRERVVVARAVVHNDVKVSYHMSHSRSLFY